MSEYGEEHSISKLIGSPAGYVGYGDNQNIFEKIRTYPFTVLILDEIERAHPKVINLFLQILDNNSIKDASGKDIYFNNVIRPNIYFYTTNQDFKKIYNVTSSNGKSPYFNMINSTIFPVDFERMKQLSLNDFLSSYLDKNRATYIIDLDITNNNEFINEKDLVIYVWTFNIKSFSIRF
jgi:ATP-dependent Clp protease ATP-binding subunit ClpA